MCSSYFAVSFSLSGCAYFLADAGVFGLGAFLEIVGILDGLAPLPGRLGVSEVSEQTERESWSSDASDASLPRRLLARLPARLPALLVGPLAVDAPRFGSGSMEGRMQRRRVKKSISVREFTSDGTETVKQDCDGISPILVGLLACDVPPFSPVSEPRLEWKVGLFSLDPDAAPCRTTVS